MRGVKHLAAKLADVPAQRVEVDLQPEVAVSADAARTAIPRVFMGRADIADQKQRAIAAQLAEVPHAPHR